VIAVVFDANVIVSGFPGTRGAPSELIERWLAGEFRLIISEHILNGVERAWRDPWFRARFSPDEAQRALALLRERAAMVDPDRDIRSIAADEEYDLVLATAVAGQASVLVTGDRRLRAVDRFRDIAICSPREFVTALEQGDMVKEL
jgi:putative PIN family toxin of toxin-antitoxin system